MCLQKPKLEVLLGKSADFDAVYEAQQKEKAAKAAAQPAPA